MTRPTVSARKNLDGEGNYVWLEATGQGHFVGVDHVRSPESGRLVGEGDDMFFIDGEKHPSINGTGSEDYFLARGFCGTILFHTPYMGLQSKVRKFAGSRSSVLSFSSGLADFHLRRGLKATIEHGHANHRSDNFFRSPIGYQKRTSRAISPALLQLKNRIPRLYAVGRVPGMLPK